MVDLSRIHPVSEFVRNYRAFLNRIKETGKPEILTVNGKPEYVILDAGSYQKIADDLERAQFIEAVQRGIADMEAGRGKTAKKAFKQIRGDLGL